MKIQKRENFSLLFVQRIDKVLNFRYNKGSKDRKLHKLCCRYAVCFRYFCDVSYPQLRELKHAPSICTPSARPTCILPAAAGIETVPCRCSSRVRLRHVSYPQLRELKHGAAYTSGAFGLCILPATAGIETSHCVCQALFPTGDVSYLQLQESDFNFSIPLTYRKNTPFGGWSRSGWRVCFLLFYIYFVSSGEKYEQYSFVLYEQLYSHR